MNKFLRGTLIAGLIVLVVGIGLIVAGFAAGATWQDVGETIFSGKFSFGSRYFGISDDIGEGPGDELTGEANTLKQVDVKKLKKLTVHMGAGDLDIQESKSGQFQINNKENRGRCFVEYKDNELAITFLSRNYGRGAKATLWIPQGVDVADVEIRVDAGKVTAEDLHGGNVTAKVGAGQLKTENIEATNLTMEVDAGQIKVQGIKTNSLDIDVDAGEFKNDGKIITDTADLRVGAGSIGVGLLDANEANLNINVGHMNIEFTGKAADYSIEADCDVGEVRIDGESYHMGKEYKSKNSEAKKSIEVDCNVGQATVKFEK